MYRTVYGGLCVALFLIAISGAFAATLPDFESLKAKTKASFIQLYDRTHQPLQELRTDFSQRRGHWLSLNEVSPALQRAILMSEDQRFERHRGVDWLAVANAAWSHLNVGAGRRGASTLSMQLADLLGQSSGRGVLGRSLHGKLNQAYAAYEIEGHYSKSQIFEAYLNLVPFKGEIVGVDTLARVLFQKHASGLNLTEAAVAAAMLRAPNAKALVLEQRACAILLQLGSPERCHSLSFVISAVFKRSNAARWDETQLAPHFSRQLLQKKPALKNEHYVQTSLDKAVQREAQRALRANLHVLQQGFVQDAAVVVLENKSGEIIAYVGASDYSAAPEVDHVLALRQSGSTLKPFLYALALSERRLTAASLLEDSALSLDTLNGLYVPQNYNLQFTGWVTVRKALASSLNIPAVRVLTLMPISDFWRVLVNLGLPLEHEADFYGYSLALGSADVDLLSLTNAYRALANFGCFTPVVWLQITKLNNSLSGDTFSDGATCDSESKAKKNELTAVDTSADSQQVISPEAAWIVADILSDRQARAYTFGLDSPLSTPFWTSVKTGTSKDMRDNWAIGFSSDYTVGVWVGNSDGSPMRDVSGVSGAAPIWHQLMSYLHKEQISLQPAAIGTLQSRDLQFLGVNEPRRKEYFLSGTELEFVSLSHQKANELGTLNKQASIVVPPLGAVYAFDPDIPSAHQQLRFSASIDADFIWKVNAKQVATGAVAWWPLVPGQFTIELYDQHGKRLDSRELIVRGKVVQ